MRHSAAVFVRGNFNSEKLYSTYSQFLKDNEPEGVACEFVYKHLADPAIKYVRLVWFSDYEYLTQQLSRSSQKLVYMPRSNRQDINWAVAAIFRGKFPELRISF